MITTDVENYPGYPDGIMGPQMMEDFRKQAERFGTQVRMEMISKVDFTGPVHKVFTKNGDLTAQSNHARQQVSEWVKYVENEPQTNASNEHLFLTGPKERMVIIGRGLDIREKLIDTKYDGVTFWTYSLMLEEARNRMNDRLASQYKLLGLEAVKPF